MRRAPRDLWLAAGLVAVLVVIIVLAATQQAQQQGDPPLASYSSAPGGARALLLWLEDLGYRANAAEQIRFAVPGNADVALLLEPVLPVSEAEWRQLDRWVEEGGTLVVAGSGFAASNAIAHFEFTSMPAAGGDEPASLQWPILRSPPIEQSGTRTGRVLRSNRSDFVTHLAAAGAPVVVSFPQGDGLVFLSTTAEPFSNAGLKLPGNPALALNIVSATNGEQIWFDEWHHGARRAEDALIGPGDWLRFTPPGRALLLAGVIFFFGLLLRGRRFGRPLAPAAVSTRRAPLEAITGAANLSRRAGHRDDVLRRYHGWLKRSLGSRYRLDPALPDDEYAAQLSGYDAAVDREALATLLARLSDGTDSEQEMIELAAETADWLNARRSPL